MHVYPIILVAAVLLADEEVLWPLVDGGEAPGRSVAWTIGPLIAVLVAQWAATSWGIRAVQRGGGARPAARAERAARWARGAIMLHHVAAVLMLGWLDAVRALLGDRVAIDELLAIGPALGALASTWWVAEPVERRVHAASLINRLDAGAPVYAMPSRAGFVLLHLRLHVLPLLVPVLVIAAANESIRTWSATSELAASQPWVVDAAAVAIALVAFIAAPLFIRPLLHVSRVESGPLRDDLASMCRRHGVRARHIFIWHTQGWMINAAVMGVIAPLRYVLLTDALVETMSREEVRAVMGHEIGHVKRRHMPWLLAAVLASLALAGMMVEWPLRTWLHWQGQESWPGDARLHMVVLVAEAVIAIAAFGWVSRRFERQADAFAVQHLSDDGCDGSGYSARAISPAAVNALCGALDTIAHLHGADRRRRSWRHGSIAWRQTFLRSIVGRPADDLAIDRQVRWLKVVIALVLALALLTMVLSRFVP
jgi:Zn-dependent protease with chaperone function